MQTLQLARLVEEAGLDVSVVQTNHPYQPAWIENLRGLRAVFRLLPYLWRVWRLCGRVDVVHLMANSGWSWQLFCAPVLWIGWLRSTPVIVNYRGGEAESYLAQSARWVRPSLSRAASLVVPSGFLQDVFSRFDIASAVIPNIIDLETFSPPSRVDSRTEFTLAVTRNLEPIYGLDVAIRALSIAHKVVPELRLVVAGSGPQRAELEALVAELGLNDTVDFCGRLSREEIVDLYHRADAALNPTHVDNMPNSVLEALACGLPVISTDVGGVPFIVQDGKTAVLVPPNDAEAMAEAMVRVRQDESLRLSLSDAGRVDVTQYAWDKVKPQWMALYERLGAAV
ncbi:MAG: glycosyltransferase family 4 protein [Halioglobus sp.]